MSETEKETKSVEKDPVQEVLESLRKNQKVIYGFLGSLLVAFGAYTAVESYQKSQEMKAQASLYKIEKAMDKVEKKLLTDKIDRKDIKFEENFGSIASSLESFISANQGRRASIRASILLGRLYGEFSKTDQALKALNLVQPKMKADMLNVLFFNQKLSRLIDSKSYDDAISLADKILSLKEMDFTHAMAKLRKAIAFEAKGEVAEAKALYKQVSEDYPEHAAGKTAKQYLRIVK